MSRRKTLPSFSSSRQMMTAWKVSGLSHSPAIIASRPASMRLAMAISPSRESSSTEPISRRYMRTGSSVRSDGSFFSATASDFALASTTSVPVSSSSSSCSSAAFSVSPSSPSASSVSTTLMPISLSIAMMSSICSGEVDSDGSTALSASKVTKPRFLAALIIFLTPASLRSSSGSGESAAPSASFSGASSLACVAFALLAICFSWTFLAISRLALLAPPQ